MMSLKLAGRLRTCRLGLAALFWALTTCLAAPASPPPVPLDPHPLPSAIQSALYGSGVAPARKTQVVAIERLAGADHFLYVALTDSAGHEVLDVWNTRQPSQPRLVSSIDFGSVLTNGVQFTPLALHPFPGGLLLQTRSGLSLYHLDDTGRLSFSRDLPPPLTGLGLGLTQLHFAGRHGSLLQQVVPNPEITGDPRQAIHRQVLLDVATPENPRLLWTTPDGPSVEGDAPVGQVFAGHPASFQFDPSEPDVHLTVFEPRRDDHHASYWQPKIDRILRPGVARQSLRALINGSLSAVPLADLQSRGLAAYQARCGPGSVTLADRVLGFHAAGDSLSTVLAHYSISRTETLESALTKILQAHTTLDDEAIVGSEWLAPTFSAWFDGIVAPEFRRATAGETRAAIGAVFNEELTEQTLVRYLTLKIVSPFLGNPEFMQWTLRDLVDALADSPAGELISAMLRACGGFGAVNAVLGELEDLVEWIPGVHWPECARYPESTRELVDLALFSWNNPAAGGGLDPDGLAWFELLKFHRYLSGHTDFSDFQAEIQGRLRTMQQSLGENFALRLAPALSGDALSLSFAEANQTFATRLPSGLLLGRLISRGLLNQPAVDARFSANTPVATALSQLGLDVGQPGRPDSSVGDLITALQELGLASQTVGDVFDLAAAAPTDLLGAHLEHALRRTLQTSFHGADLDAPLLDLLGPCIDFDVGLKDLLGSWMAGLVNEMLASGPTMSGRLLTYRHAFESRDCLAQWLVLLDAVTAATSWLGLAEVPMALEYALSEAYQAAVNELVQTMFGVLISEIMGNFSGDESLWLASQLAPVSRSWSPIEPAPNTTSSILGAFTWQSRAACVVQRRFETNWFGPRALELVLCHPDQPESSRQAFDLGRWWNVNYVHHHQGALVISGSYFAPTDTTLPSGKCLVVDIESNPPRIQHLTGDDHAPLSSAPRLAGFNRDTGLAVGGVNQVFLLPHPAGLVAAASEPVRPPQILSLPDAAQASPGNPCHLEPRILGTPPFAFQWLENGSALSTATTPALRIDASNQVAAVEFTLVVRNAAGETRASSVVGFPSSPPVFVLQPADQAVLSGQPVSFICGVSGGGDVRVQWFHRGVPIPGAIHARLQITNTQPNHAGAYWAEADLGPRPARTREAHLAVIQADPPILVGTSPVQQPLAVGSATNLAVRSVGWGPLEFQWFKDDRPLDGAHGAALAVGPATAASTGEYRVEIQDAGGRGISQVFGVSTVGNVVLSCSRKPSGTLAVHLTGGDAGQAFALERSTDLVHWSVARASTFPMSGTAEIDLGADTPAGSERRPSAFFRIILGR